MALVRCNEHKPKPRKLSYVATVEPLGYPETSSICGSTHCKEAGLVWLTEDEHLAYQDGQRIFEIPNNANKLKVK